MDQLPSKQILKTPIAGDQQASKTPSSADLLRTGIKKRFSNAYVTTWSSANISYSPSDNVVYGDGVYVCTSTHTSTSQDPKTPGTSGAPWSYLGTRDEFAHNYLLRGDLNAFLFALSDFLFGVQCAGMKALDFQSTSGSVITSGVGGFPKGAVRTVIGNTQAGSSTEFLVASSKINDNKNEPNPQNLIAGTDQNWSLLTPSLGNIDIFSSITYSRDNTLGQANPNVVYAVPSQTQGVNWGGGCCKSKVSEALTKNITSVFAASSPISEIWYMEKQSDIPAGSSDVPSLRQVYGWRNYDNQKVVGNGITSGVTSVTLLRGRYKLIVIGAGGGPFKVISKPGSCVHYYGNPGNGGAALYGIARLDHGVYQVGIADDGAFIASSNDRIVFAQSGANAYVISKHTPHPVPNVALPKVTFTGGRFVEVTALNGAQGVNNGMCKKYSDAGGTGGAAPLGTVYGKDCSSFGNGEGYSPSGNQGVEGTLHQAGSAFVYIEYAGPYDGIPV